VSTKYHVAGVGKTLLIAAPGNATAPHVGVAWGPMTFTATAGDGSVTTFVVTATLTTDASASGLNGNEGRCRIDGSVIPTS